MKTKVCGLLLVALLGWSSTAYAQYVPKEKRKKNEPRVDTVRQTPPPQNPDNQVNRPTKSRPDNLFSKLNYGGNFGLAFGDITRIDIQPLVGYPLTDKFQMGIGLNYQFYSERGIFNGQNYQFSQSYYGGRGFMQFLPIPQVFAWAEIETNYGNYYNRADGTLNKRWVTLPFVGLGYRQSNSDGFSGGMITVLYNLNYNPDFLLYPSPLVIRIGGFF
ncbi:MAG: hypothetical protein MUE85_15425 [Microscillaceae bacterium]|nr:hypothetical protein [Microscillaceae bacterium]